MPGPHAAKPAVRRPVGQALPRTPWVSRQTFLGGEPYPDEAERADKLDHEALRGLGPVFRRVLWQCVLYTMRGVARMPWGAQCAIGGVVGLLLHFLMRRRRGIAQRNLALCFPGLDETARSRIVRRHFRALGLGLVEIALAWWGNDEQIARRSRIIGAEHLEAALSHGRGVILLGGHFTTFEIGGRVLASNFEVGATYRPHSDAWWDSTLRIGRTRYLANLIPHKDVRSMIRHLGRNRILWYAPDQNYSGQRGVFARFFAERAATTTAPAWLARRTGASIVPYASYRRADDSGWDIVLDPALRDFPSGDELADAERLNALLQVQIGHGIEQYLWVHRRFKTRPPDVAPAYEAALLRRPTGSPTNSARRNPHQRAGPTHRRDPTRADSHSA